MGEVERKERVGEPPYLVFLRLIFSTSVHFMEMWFLEAITMVHR